MTNNMGIESTLSPKDWLAFMRKRHGLDMPFRWSKGVDHLILQLPEDQRERAAKIWKCREGKTIAEIHEEQFQVYIDRIIPALTESQQALMKETYFGLYPSHTFDGYATWTPKGDRIVLLHDGLPHSLALWSHLFVRQMEQGGGLNTLTENLPAFIQVLEYFASVWLGKISEMPNFEIYPKTTDGWQLSEELTHAAICFVLGHEMGHVHLQHKGYTDDIDANHAMEFSADIYGLNLCIRYMLLHSARYLDNYFTMLMLFGPFLALSVITLIGSEDSNTHPGAVRRSEFLIKNLETELRKVLSNKYELFLEEINPDLINIIERNNNGLLMICKAFSQDMKVFLSPANSTDFRWISGRGC
jgi:hypothetical protein